MSISSIWLLILSSTSEPTIVGVYGYLLALFDAERRCEPSVSIFESLSCSLLFFTAFLSWKETVCTRFTSWMLLSIGMLWLEISWLRPRLNTASTLVTFALTLFPKLLSIVYVTPPSTLWPSFCTSDIRSLKRSFSSFWNCVAPPWLPYAYLAASFFAFYSSSSCSLASIYLWKMSIEELWSLIGYGFYAAPRCFESSCTKLRMVPQFSRY